jgi:murein DD-endopeptidase MepM/ murein hydrolase activator NlpD
MKIRSILNILLIFYAVNAAAITLPQHSPTPGGVAVIKLGPASQARPVVHYQDKPVMVQKQGQSWVAVVGIPLAAKTGKHDIQINHRGQQRSHSFDVKDKKYRTQRLTIKNKRKVNPNEQDMQRIIKERERIVAALKHWRDQDDVNMEFVPPVKGRMSSSFGLRRFFNDQPRKPHSGMDIAAPQGTPIYAPGAGIVVETGDYFFNGKTVFLDHGQGLVTMYGHMHRIDVKPGQVVKTGTQLGLVGKTGRVTGAHLHWGISLNDARVDPRLFLAKEEAK